MTERQNAHLTFKDNKGVSRHDWIRLTPAYSHRLVRYALREANKNAHILDPFAGTGTTGLVAAEMGMDACLLDVNPFLVWFGRAKTRNYTAEDISKARVRLSLALDMTRGQKGGRIYPVPPMYKIERWWSRDTLHTLARLKQALDELHTSSPSDDLLEISFCRVMMANSNAAFNHQSMSFKKAVANPPQAQLFEDGLLADEIPSAFSRETDEVLSSASVGLAGHATAMLGDARQMDSVAANSVDLLYTSPPYANRMSYIRELRPYMYWLGFLKDAKQAGELDWKAIGGTWGVATSRLATWEPTSRLPLGKHFARALEDISRSGRTNADTLARYVHKYFVDMFDHFRSARRVLKAGATATYIVGNSVFYGVLVPTEAWYAELLSAAGFGKVRVEKIRKRNSKRELFEYRVSALRL